MALVGDIILGLRTQAPDRCQFLAAPVNVTGTASVSTPGFTAGSTVYFRVTQGNQWGESNATLEQLATNASQFIVTVSGNCSRLATFVRIYYTNIGSGLEDEYVQIALSNQNAFSTAIGGLTTVPPTPAVPPSISSAYLPDSDGTAISAAEVYRWMEDGLKLAGHLTDGIRDITGIPSVTGVAQYNVIGLWKKFDNQFFDGYPFAAGTKGQIFRHSPVTGLTGVGTLNSFTDRQVVELWPQANRTAGVATLASGITATSTSLAFTPGSSSFVLGFGMALLGNYPPNYPLSKTGLTSTELIYYSPLSGGQLLNLTRGMGGTIAQAWPTGTNLQELNIYFSGLRFPITYRPGMAALSTGLPPAWEDLIRTYLLYRFRDAETARNEASDLLKEFYAKAQALKGNKIVMGPRQIQIGGSGGVEIAVGAGSPFGGIILP